MKSSRKDTKCSSPMLNIWAPMGLRNLALPAHDDYGLPRGPASARACNLRGCRAIPSAWATQSSLSQFCARPTQEHRAVQPFCTLPGGHRFLEPWHNHTLPSNSCNPSAQGISTTYTTPKFLASSGCRLVFLVHSFNSLYTFEAEPRIHPPGSASEVRCAGGSLCHCLCCLRFIPKFFRIKI